MKDKDYILAAANVMTDKGYQLGDLKDAIQFKANRMLYTLVQYRDAGMNTYTYFWKNEEERIASPFFDSEKEAHDWMASQSDWDAWKSNKQFV